jgi:uroporphyrinogen decarboxylase
MTSSDPDFNRLLTVLRRQGEPDRVPLCELFHDSEIIAAVMCEPRPEEGDAWRRWRVDFHTRLGYDHMRGYHTVLFPTHETLTTTDTAVHNRGVRGWQDVHGGPIGSWEDFERYPWPQVTDAAFEDIERLAPMLPAGMKLTPTMAKGMLENLIRLMGYEGLCFAMIEEPDLVQAVADGIGNVSLEVFRRLCGFDHVGALWINDDLGFKTQTMVSPAQLRQFVFPWHRRLVELAHAHDRPVMLHACGNLREVYEDIIDVRIDAKHSFEDVIQPVAEFKREYGSRVAVLGGIDMDVLARGTVEEVKAYTRRVIEQCAPGGGWALGSGNSVANYIPVDNFLAMLEVGREVGGYR